MSGGNDNTLRLWDLTSATTIATCRGHTDYVRCASESPTSGHGNVWATGAYDHTVRVWDARATAAAAAAAAEKETGPEQNGVSGAEKFCLDHGDPVDAVVHLKNGALLASAGGPRIKVCVCYMCGRGGSYGMIKGNEKGSSGRRFHLFYVTIIYYYVRVFRVFFAPSPKPADLWEFSTSCACRVGCTGDVGKR